MAHDVIESMTATDADAALRTTANAVLIDVRTPHEWEHVGKPNTEALPYPVIFEAWIDIPGGPVCPDFASHLEAQLQEKGLSRDTTACFLLCRSGARSLAAANHLQQLGWQARLINVADGFEGSPTLQKIGWRQSGLPSH